MSKRHPEQLSVQQQRHWLEQCWLLECDIDPLILRARLLHRRKQSLQARAVEQEVQPIF